MQVPLVTFDDDKTLDRGARSVVAIKMGRVNVDTVNEGGRCEL